MTTGTYLFIIVYVFASITPTCRVVYEIWFGVESTVPCFIQAVSIIEITYYHPAFTTHSPFITLSSRHVDLGPTHTVDRRSDSPFPSPRQLPRTDNDGTAQRSELGNRACTEGYFRIPDIYLLQVVSKPTAIWISLGGFDIRVAPS